MSEPTRLPVSNLRDIPAMLRKLADELDNGTTSPFLLALVIGINKATGELKAYHFGETRDSRYLLGILAEAGHIVFRDFRP